MKVSMPRMNRTLSHHPRPILHYLIIISLFTALFFISRFIFLFRSDKIEREKLLDKAVLLEGRFRTFGHFFQLFSWFKAVDELEKKHFESFGHYIESANLPEHLVVRTDKIARDMRTFFWNGHIFLDTFIPFDTLKADMAQRFGYNFTDLDRGRDTSLFSFEFHLDPSRSRYSVTVSEKKDVNYDGDTDDFFITDSESPKIRFIDRENKNASDEFETRYAEILYEIASDTIPRPLP
jgi:hypothetical protein